MTTAFLGFCHSLLGTKGLPFEPGRYKQDVLAIMRSWLASIFTSIHNSRAASFQPLWFGDI
jgi:hypothetical protein